MKLTDFTFFKNTPFTDFQNTILFDSNSKRDDFFLGGGKYSSIVFSGMRFNFIRDKQSIILPVEYRMLSGVNYCTFISDFEPDIRYYAYVINYEYLNDGATKVDLLIDGIMTFCQGDVINNFTNLSVERKTMGLLEYNERIEELKNNGDILKTFTKKYSHNSSYLFKTFDILIQSSADLTAKFGTVKAPVVETSEGLTFDKISSPLNLYVVKQTKFVSLMKALSPYPWISQNIRSVALIPSILLEDKITKVNMRTTSFKELFTLNNNGSTNKLKFDTALLNISKTIADLHGIFNLDAEQDKHLLRNEYTTTEVYSYDGQQLFIDNGQLSDKYGLHFMSAFVSGFHNEIGIYIEGYKAKENVGLRGGSFLNDAIFFKNFDDVPILIDNYNLSMAKSANRTALAESQLVTNRIKSLTDDSASVKDRFYNATSLASNFNPMTLFGKFNDEHDFYKQQQAEMADLALDTPTIGAQSNNNSLTIAEGFFGIHVKHAQPTRNEWHKVKRYYKAFGYEVNDENSRVNVHSNTMLDYVKFKGSITIEDADVSIVEMIKAQFENGIRFWHDNGMANPMSQDLIKNRMR